MPGRCRAPHVWLAIAATGGACARPDGGDGKQRPAARASASAANRPEIDRALETLRREEEELRARTDFSMLAPSNRSLGSNPYAIANVESAAGASRFAGVLRGASSVVLLDVSGAELARQSSVASPNSLAALPDGRLFVVGDIEPRIARYRLESSGLVRDSDLSLPDALSLRAVSADARALFVADFWGDRLFSKPLASGARDTAFASFPLCGGPIRLALTEHFLGVVCLFDHSLAIYERDPKGFVSREVGRVTHDGPIWGASLAEQGGSLFVAAGGVEDHPLDRGDKAFGYVDSFVYLYRVDPGRPPTRLFALNSSELGVVTPKIARIGVSASSIRVAVVGYASDKWLELELGRGANGDPAGGREGTDLAGAVLTEHSGVPGCSDVAPAGDTLVCANPLLDAWVSLSANGRQAPRIERTTEPPTSPAERLGETLFFTTLMAPDATSAGKRSRFTCETCHFEGGTDGRVHHSGRGDIRVSTRPLLGLMNDAPHFSRAHDPDLTSVSNNEFSVANRGNPIDPWFSLSRQRFPWLGELGVTEESVGPLELRRALLVFLARFSHAENPLAVRRPPPRRFSADERRGAELFRDRCASCHAARLVARDRTKEVPFERWEALVLSPEGPMVWSNGEYAKTGVLPYVDPKGTQAPSLRRLYLKRPYLTNGSARTLEAVLENARFAGPLFWHAPGGDARGNELARDEQRSLVQFLRLL
jgi:hypothetical protein